jgi:hypothetical protein
MVFFSRALLVLYLCAVMPSGVFGQAMGTPKAQKNAQVDDLYDQAKIDIKAARLPFAIEKLRGALAVQAPDPQRAWKVLIALAIAYDEMKRPLRTLEYIQLYLNALDAYGKDPGKEWNQRRTMMEEWIGELRGAVLKSHSGVDIRSTPGGARILLDGRAYGDEGAARTPFSVFVPPGKHTVRVELAGYKPFETLVTTETGRAEVLHPILERVPQVVVPVKTASTKPKVVKAARKAPPVVKDERGAHSIFDAVWGWVAIGGGAAIAVAGVPFTVMAARGYDEQWELQYKPNNEKTRERHASLGESISKNQVVAGILYGTGIAAMAGGAVYVWLATRQTEDGAKKSVSTSSPLFGVTPYGDGAVMTYGWRW